ncbi:MAG: DUF1501 domain-containing protein [Gemmataceae bacterium]
MLSFFDTNKKGSRREFLRVGSLAGLSLPMLLGAKAQGAETGRSLTTGKSVVLLMMHGGPSQIETFDPKPDAPSNTRSATGVLRTSVPGMQFGGTFPRLGRLAHRLAVVRSYASGDGNHDIKPVVSRHSLGCNLGSLYARVVGPLSASGLPSNIGVFPSSVDAAGPGPRMNFGNFLATGSLGASYAPFVPGASGEMQQNLALNIARDRVDDRRALLNGIDRLRRDIDASGGMASVDRLHAQAFDVILSGVARAFDLKQEDPRSVARYDTARHLRTIGWTHKNNRNQYDAHSKCLGKELLLARRMVEAGCGFVLVNTEFVWDMHQDVNNLGCVEGMDYVGTPFDHAVSAFIEDLEVRGLSDKVLLIATGEMGRTPRLQDNGGRNHWGRLTPLLAHGAGVTGGQIIGHSSRDGGEPASSPFGIPNVIATIMHTLFNIGEVRLMSGLPADVNRVITESAPIAGLV